MRESRPHATMTAGVVTTARGWLLLASALEHDMTPRFVILHVMVSDLECVGVGLARPSLEQHAHGRGRRRARGRRRGRPARGPSAAALPAPHRHRVSVRARGAGRRSKVAAWRIPLRARKDRCTRVQRPMYSRPQPRAHAPERARSPLTPPPRPCAHRCSSTAPRASRAPRAARGLVKLVKSL